MATLPLLITWTNIERRIKGASQNFCSNFDKDDQDEVLEYVHNHLRMSADSATPGDSLFPTEEWKVKQLQIACGAALAALMVDNPAGTGSLSSVSIGDISQSNTMAWNNAAQNEFWLGTQYAREFHAIMMSAPINQAPMIC